MTDLSLNALNACNVGIAVVLLALAIVAGSRAADTIRGASYTRRVYATTTYVCVLLLWPIVWNCLVGFQTIRHIPLLLLSFLWPYVLIGLNVKHAHRTRDVAMHHRSTISMDVSALAGFTFAMGGLIASQWGKQTSICTSAIFSTGFLCVLAVVLPNLEIPSDYNLSVVIESLQQTMLHYAIALLLAGICINLSVSACASRRNPHLLRNLLAGVESSVAT